jgi:deazaflavin-dependent oxidoreductase (nitroreductase family)
VERISGAVYDHLVPLPTSITRFNRSVTNRVMKPFARHAPKFGVVIAYGRKSGTRYETPVNVFAANGGVLIALSYGDDVDWLKNVLAAGECEVVRSGSAEPFESPIVVGADEALAFVPSVFHPVFRGLGISKFLLLTSR